MLRVSLLWLLLGSCLTWASLTPDNGYLLDYETATAEFDARDYSSAHVHLKNALKKRPDHLPSRLLLGRTHLKLGRAPEAEKELLIALRRGAAKDRVVVPLGNALLLQRKYPDILDKITIEGISSSGRYEVLTLRGRAQREMGKLEDAHFSFDQAIAHNDKLMEAYLGKSRTFSAAGDYVNAELLIDTARDRDADSNELLFEKASIRRRQGDNARAMELYNMVLAEAPNHMRARLGRASLSLQLGDVEQAQSDSKYVHSRIPQDPDASLLYAQTLSRLGQPDEAKEVLLAASEYLSGIDDKTLLHQPGLLRIAALISLQRGLVDRANFYLDRYVELVPQEVRIRVISARVKLQLDDTDGAIQLLEPVYRSGTQDAQVFSLLGEAYLVTGRFDEAQTVLEKAAQLEPDLPQVNTRLALSKIGSGEVADAWDDLSIANSKSKGASVTSGIVMTIMLVRNREYERALSSAEELQERHPRNPVVINLVGIIRLSRHELTQARAAFERALSAHPTFVPAMYNLGLVELEAKKLDNAEEWFSRIVELKPQQSNALLGLAEINVARRNYDSAISMLLKATATKNNNLTAHTRLIEIQVLAGDISAAQREGAILSGRYLDNPRVFELLGQVEIAAGNRAKAISHLRRAAQLADDNGVTKIRIADQLAELKDDQTAKTALVLALTTNQRMAAQERLVSLYLRKDDITTARIHAKKVREEEPEAALGYVLEAKILKSEGKYEEAISQYQQGLAIQDNRDAVLQLYALYDVLGLRQNGFQLLQTWLQKDPEDSIAQRVLALGYLRADRREEAQSLLEVLVETRPNDSLVLASLAQLYMQNENPGARALAERALQAAPNWAIALDTYGWVLVQANEAEAGLEYLREAITRDSNPLIRYHLAAALHNLGRDSEAMAQLEIILRLDPEPQWIDSVKVLSDTITGTE